MIKNSFKLIISIILIITTSACSSNSNSFWEFKPHFSTGTYIDAYAIIEDGKVNRMGIPKEDIDKMNDIINDKYGIQFIDDNRIYALKDFGKNYRIKFYNDFKMTVNGKEYIISKEKIRYSKYDYYLKLPVKITHTDYNGYILDTGEIEIIDTDGKIIRPKTEIPPILLKKIIYRRVFNNINGKEYIMSKEKIRYSEYDYDLKLPVKIAHTDYDEYILDIGEIEIIDTDGKIIRPRTKIPPILFKKTIYRTFVNDINGYDFDVYYRGWAEDYPKDPSTLKKMYNSIEEMKKSFKESKKEISNN